MKEYYIFIDEARNEGGFECKAFETKDEALTRQANSWFYEKLQGSDEDKIRFDVGMIRYSDERWAQALEDDGPCFDEDEEDELKRAEALASEYDYDEAIYTLDDLLRVKFDAEYDEDFEIENAMYDLKYGGKYWDILNDQPLEEYLNTTPEKVEKVKAIIKKYRWKEEQLKRDRVRDWHCDDQMRSEIRRELGKED